MPGFNVKAPFVTTVYQIVVRPETDTMESIISITKDGIQNTFNDVQVTNLDLITPTPWLTRSLSSTNAAIPKVWLYIAIVLSCPLIGC